MSGLKRARNKAWLSALALLGGAVTLAACPSPGADELARIERIRGAGVTPSAEPLPLELQTMRNVIQERDGLYSRNHVITTGNWMASCQYSRNGNGEHAACDVAPFSGEILSGHPVPVPNMAVTEHRSGRAPTITLVIHSAQAGTGWAYACGNRTRQIGEGLNGRALLDERASQVFLNVMKTRDCEFSFVPEGSQDRVVIRHLAHGFEEAHTYATRYVTSPD
ncbi:hypothetical protein [Ponticaulis sp.]|uniref:hypothetical protein n=1 Tax=Ponticaulis sp. TaxID=2020902 RepID=UPI0025FFB760|nr:hypothetical protein [Ponticaulis sp.]|tara:strand:- start:288 stop:953 length:666 start_codon:yes stop_codon:yes gene_type:complete